MIPKDCKVGSVCLINYLKQNKDIENTNERLLVSTYCTNILTIANWFKVYQNFSFKIEEKNIDLIDTMIGIGKKKGNDFF